MNTPKRAKKNPKKYAYLPFRPTAEIHERIVNLSKVSGLGKSAIVRFCLQKFLPATERMLVPEIDLRLNASKS